MNKNPKEFGHFRPVGVSSGMFAIVMFTYLAHVKGTLFLSEDGGRIFIKEKAKQ